jgi:hypothetical protein
MSERLPDGCDATVELDHRNDFLSYQIDSYVRLMKASSNGPQREGLPIYDLENTLLDENSVIIPYDVDSYWPLITPIENNSEYLTHYFQIYRQGKAFEYLSLPALEYLDANPEFTEIAIARILSALDEDKSLVFEESPGRNIIQFLANHGVDPQLLAVDTFRDSRNDTESAVIHYEGLTNVEMSNPEGEILTLRDAYSLLDIKRNKGKKSGTYLLNPKHLNYHLSANNMKAVDRLWEIYLGQFTQLVQSHPARQMQTKDEFTKMVSDTDTLTVAHYTEGDIVSFGMFVGNIESCDWLNTDFYKERYGDNNALYFPGIATDVEKQGHKYALELIDLIAQIISKSGKNRHIVFQCTNISADYIPKIVEYGARESGIADINIKEYWRYNYVAIRKKILGEENANCPIE